MNSYSVIWRAITRAFASISLGSFEKQIYLNLNRLTIIQDDFFLNVYGNYQVPITILPTRIEWAPLVGAHTNGRLLY